MTPIPVQTLVLYPRPHVDNITALFLLREFGREAFPGIETAKLEFWAQVPPGKTAEDYEREGILLVDIGNGRFDHHQQQHLPNDQKTTATHLVAQHLGLIDQVSFKRLLEFVRRDDIEGRGITSKDPIDRAFGLPAIIMNLNRDYAGHPEYVVEMVTRMIHAHYNEEYRRKVLMPQEWEELKASGKATMFSVPTPQRPLNVVMVESDSPTIVGFLRAITEVQADVVVQRMSAGNTNIVTRQSKDRTMPKLNLNATIAMLRQAEAQKKGLALGELTGEVLAKPGRLEGIDEWYYDTAANTIQNGGAASAGVMPTRLTMDELKQILERTLTSAMPAPSRPAPTSSAGPSLSLSDLQGNPRPQNPPRR